MIIDQNDDAFLQTIHFFSMIIIDLRVEIIINTYYFYQGYLNLMMIVFNLSFKKNDNI